MNKEQIQKLKDWLTVKGVRENSLLKAIKGVQDKLDGGFEEAYKEWCIQEEENEDAKESVEDEDIKKEESKVATEKQQQQPIKIEEDRKKEEEIVVDLFNDQITGESEMGEIDPAALDERKAALEEKRLATLRMSFFGLADAMPKKFLKDKENPGPKEEVCGKILDAVTVSDVAGLVLKFYDFIDPEAFEDDEWASNSIRKEQKELDIQEEEHQTDDQKEGQNNIIQEDLKMDERDENKNEWWWTREVKEAQTLSQLAVAIEQLDAVCPWAMRCHNCRKKFGQCRYVTCFNCAHSFHLSCVKPVLPRVPTGDWFCSDCKAVEKELLAKSQDVCYVCGRAGKLLCCDSCPKVFHLACCGLTKLPRGNWYCSYCTQKRWDGGSPLLLLLPQRRAKTRCIEANAELSEYERSNKRHRDEYGDDDDDDAGYDDGDVVDDGDESYKTQKDEERPHKRLKKTGGYEEDGSSDEFRKGHFLRKRTSINYSDAYNTRMMIEGESGERKKATYDEDDENDDDNYNNGNENENIRRLQYGLRLRPRKKYTN